VSERERALRGQQQKERRRLQYEQLKAEFEDTPIS